MRSLGRASRCGGRRRAVDAGLEQDKETRPTTVAQLVLEERQTYNWEVWGSTPSGVGLVEGSSIVCAAVGAINASPEQRAGHSIPATNHGPETRVVVSPYTR